MYTEKCIFVHLLQSSINLLLVPSNLSEKKENHTKFKIQIKTSKIT